MARVRSHRSSTLLFASLLLLWAPDHRAESASRLRTILGPLLGTAVVNALAGARLRIARPECARIFSDFDDGRGRSLQAVLDSRGLSAPEFLDTVLFADGIGQDHCRQGRALALTTPGSRVVYVCGA